MSQNFKSIIVNEKNGKINIDIKKRSIDKLPHGELLIKVEYSSLNYKDALSASGVKGVTKKYPHTPGIDAAGVVIKSISNNFPIGTRVIVTGFDLGMNTSGGFSEYIRVPSQWAIKCPSTLTTKRAMMIGTAGLTAGLSVNAMTKTINLEDSEVIISGATGGVGSIGVNLLSKLGANVTAITSKIKKEKSLLDLGASKVIDKNIFLESTKLPLNKGIHNAALDVVGGNILTSIIASMKYGGVIATTGNACSPIFETTVFPFILRANSLIGIDSANCSIEMRRKIWKNFASKWKLKFPHAMQKTVNLENMIPEIRKILKGQQVGRVLLEL